MVGIRNGDVIRIEETNYIIASVETTDKEGLVVELKNITGDDQPRTLRLLFDNNRATSMSRNVGTVSRKVLDK
jgi:hypothetical protein